MGLQLSLVRVSACHAEGREFEPRQSRHLKDYLSQMVFFIAKRDFLGSSRLSWICSTLTEFRFKHFVQVRSICSLSGLASVRKSARQSRHLKRLSFIDGLFYCKKGTSSALLACLAKAQNLNIQIVNETLKYSQIIRVVVGVTSHSNLRVTLRFTLPKIRNSG